MANIVLHYGKIHLEWIYVAVSNGEIIQLPCIIITQIIVVFWEIVTLRNYGVAYGNFSGGCQIKW